MLLKLEGLLCLPSWVHYPKDMFFQKKFRILEPCVSQRMPILFGPHNKRIDFWTNLNEVVAI